MASDKDTDEASEVHDVPFPKKIKFSNISSSNLEEKFEKGMSYDLKESSFVNKPNDDDKVNEITGKTVFKKKQSLGLDEMLTCNICCDIMYNCISIRPCLHTYCGVCLFDWMVSGDVCPMCRGEIEGVSKNHLLTNIINKYLEEHPDKVKPQNERDDADRRVLDEMNKFNAIKPSTSVSQDLAMQLSINGCPYCHYPNTSNSNISTVDLTEAPLSHYQCTPVTGHTQCQCCNIYIPILLDTVQYPKQKCQICNRISCSLLLSKCRSCLQGCLHIFKEFLFNPNLNSNNQVPQFLPENYFETSILRNYLNSQNITVVDMFKNCLDRALRGELNLGHFIDNTTVLCLHCSRQMVLDMVYEYVRLIPKSILPANVTARPDCYYGRNCRTQRTRQHHAMNYNHVCPQTRF